MKKPIVNEILFYRANDADCISYRIEFVKWFTIVSGALIVYGIFAWLTQLMYHPDISKVLDYARKVSISPVTGNTFAPEPRERFLFLAAIVIFPLVIFLFSFLLNKMSCALVIKRSDLLYIVSLALFVSIILGTTYFSFTADNPFFSPTANATVKNAFDLTAKSNWDFYFGTTFLYHHLRFYLALLFPAILFLYLFHFHASKQGILVFSMFKSCALYAFFISIITVIFFMDFFSFPATRECLWDFNSVYYSVVQVFRGQPLLVNNFTNTYGLYPHFIVPLLKLIGLSIRNFSAIMASLIVLCFSLVFYSMTATVKEKSLVLFGFATIVFNCFLFSKIVAAFDIYYALFPIRWIFPSLLLSYSVLYLKKPTKLLYFPSFFVFSAGILWNPDFGVVTFLSLLLFYFYLEMKDSKNPGCIIRLATHALIAAGALIITFASYMVIIKLFYGNVPDVLEMFSTSKIFALVGLNMLPMPRTFHPWMLVAIIYCAGLTYAINAVVRKKITGRSAFVMVVTVLGIGLFSYYQGRSHNWNLPSCCLPAFILLTVFADDLYVHCKRRGVFAVPFALTMLFLSFSFFQIIYDYTRITELMTDTLDRARIWITKMNIEKNAAFIHKTTQEGEKVFIFTAPPFSSLYFDLSGTSSIENPGLGELFFRADYQRLLYRLTYNENTKVFFDPATIINLFYDNKIPAVLAALYDIENRGDSATTMLLLAKKKPFKSREFLIKSGPGELIHELPENNLNKKLAYAEGQNGSIELGRTFSIEMIFKPSAAVSSPLTNDPVLLTNFSNNDGFYFGRPDIAGPNYLFTAGNNRIFIPIVAGAWNYVCIEYNNSEFRAFANGAYIGSTATNCPYQESVGPLFLGSNRMQSGFFFGAIRELRISRTLLDEKAILETMKKVTML